MPDEDIQPTEATVEELPSPAPVVVAVPLEGEMANPPAGEADLAYRLGRLETRIVEIEKSQAAVEAALVVHAAGDEAENAAQDAVIEQQGEVVDAVAEEVLPADDPAALANNPAHGHSKPGFFDRLFGGHA